MSYIVFLSTKGLQMVQGNVSKNNINDIFLLLIPSVRYIPNSLFLLLIKNLFA